MSQPVNFQKTVRPACLAQSNTVIRAKPIGTGWGYTEFGGQTSDVLQKVELSIIDVDQCRRLYDDQDNYGIDDTQLCAGELEGGKDTCQVRITSIKIILIL